MAHDADPAATLLLLHGRGGGPASMEGLARSLELPGVDWVAPAAPGGSWYPERFVAPRATNEPNLTDALTAVHRTLDDLEARGVAPERVVLGGFSQGACLACDALAGHPRRVGALAVLSGGLIGAGADEFPQPGPGSLAGLPVLLTVAEQDDWIPVERVRDTAGVLRAAGADVDLRVFPPRPHGVHPDEVDALRELVRSVADRAGRR